MGRSEDARLFIKETRRHNSDFVVDVLVQIFDKDEQTATMLMLSIHEGSYAVAGIYPKDLAYTKAAEAVQWAREEGYPLKVEAVRR